MVGCPLPKGEADGGYHFLRIIDIIEHAVIADPYPKVFPSVKFFDVVGERIFFERKERFNDFVIVNITPRIEKLLDMYLLLS